MSDMVGVQRSRMRAVWSLIATWACFAPSSCAYDYDAPFANAGGTGGTGGFAGSQAGSAGLGGSIGDASTADQSAGNGGDAAVDHPIDQTSDNAGDGPLDDQAVDQAGGDAEDATGGDAGDCPTSHACVPEAPALWSGPFALRESGTSTVSCTGAYDQQAYRLYDNMLPAADASCSTCTCGAVTGQTCRMDVALFQSSNCTNNCKTIDTHGNTCFELFCNGYPQLGSIRFGSHISGTGSCGASPQDASVEPIAWEDHAVLCEATALNACTFGNVCVPIAAPPFQPELCVARTGTHPCLAPYTQSRTLYEEATDTRGCTSCSCDDPQGGSCGGSMVLNIPGPTCGGPGVVYPPENYCMTLSPPETSAAIVGPLSLSGAGCAPSGGVPTGSASPSSPVSVCCLP